MCKSGAAAKLGQVFRGSLAFCIVRERCALHVYVQQLVAECWRVMGLTLLCTLGFLVAMCVRVAGMGLSTMCCQCVCSNVVRFGDEWAFVWLMCCIAASFCVSMF